MGKKQPTLGSNGDSIRRNPHMENPTYGKHRAKTNEVALVGTHCQRKRGDIIFLFFWNFHNTA